LLKKQGFFFRIMKIKDCYQVGYIMKPHAISGSLNIFLDVDFPEDYENMDSVFVLIDGNLVPYFIKNLNLRNNKSIVEFEDIDTIEKAENMVGKELYLPLTLLPKLNDKQFYFHEIENYQIIDTNLGELGKILTVYSFPNQDLIAMMYKDAEILIPINDEIILKVDKINHTMTVCLPEGLIDIYLES
jgi:16S rRNA processing protein RimM